MKKIILYTSILLLLFSCSPKVIRKTIDLKQERVFIKSYRDKSGIKSAKTFPESRDLQKKLFEKLEDINRKLAFEIEKYSTVGQYEIVDDSKTATITIQLQFLPYKVEEQDFTIGCKIAIKNLARRSKKEHNFSVTNTLLKKSVTGDYHFWGEHLSGIKRNFPYTELGKLFYSKQDLPNK